MIFSPAQLHIPDGFLTIIVSLIFWLVTVIMVGLAVSKTNQSLGEKQIPLMGVMAAFIFAAQMLNFPIAGGTSGHFLGGALASIVLGPWAGILVMTAVVGVQALLFQDGGLLVMGANIFNMGILTAVIGYGLYRLVIHQKQGLRLAMSGGAAWIATMAAALMTSLQLWLSGTTRLEIVLPAMLGVHALIGVGEALITVAALGYIEKTRPDLLDGKKNTPEGGRGWIAAGILFSLIAVLLSPF
ncbi:MAG: energy-coupling factor ABC transporter permease, partial [Anaerolineales bacterium]|nr:energy-coupling factor ABC transporter permease [Anaerolineales bacterium]